MTQKRQNMTWNYVIKRLCVGWRKRSFVSADRRHSSVLPTGKREASEWRVQKNRLPNFKLTRVTKERRGSDVRITVYYEGDSDPEEIIPHQGRVQADFNEHGIEPMFSFKLPNYPLFQYMLLLRNLTADVPNSENIVELGFRVDPGRELTYNLGQDVTFSVSLDSTTSKHYFFSDDVYLRQDVENSQIKLKKLWTRDEGYPLQCLGQTRQNDRAAIHYRLKTDGDPKGLIQITADATCFSGCLVTWVLAMTYIRFYPSYMYGPFPPYYIGFTEPHPPWQKPYCFAHWKCELFCAAVGDGPTMMNIKKVTNYGYEQRNVQIGKLLDFYISARVVLRQATVDDSEAQFCLRRHSFVFQPANVKANFKLTRVTKEPRGTEMRITIYYEGARNPELPGYPFFQFLLLLRNLTEEDVPNSENIADLGFRIDPGRDLTYDPGQDVNFSVSLDSTTSKYYFFQDDVYLGDGPTLIRINKVTSNGTQRMNVQIGKQLDFFIFARIILSQATVDDSEAEFCLCRQKTFFVFQPANVKHRNGVCKGLACDVDSDFLVRPNRNRSIHSAGQLQTDTSDKGEERVGCHHSMQEIIPQQGRVQADFNKDGIKPMFSFKLPNYPFFEFLLYLRNLTVDGPNSENIVELGFRVDPGRELTYDRGQDVNFSVSLDSTTSKHYFFDDDVYLRQNVENSQIKFKKLWTRDEGYPLQCLGQTKQNGRVASHYRLKTDGDPKGLIQITASPTCFSGCLVTWVAAMTYIRFYPSYMYGPFPPYYIGFTEPHPPWQKLFCFAHWKCELFCAAVGDGPTMMNIKKVTNYGHEQRNVKISKLLDFYISARVVLRQATVDDSEAQFSLCRHSFVFQPANVKANFKLTRVTKERRASDVRITVYYEGDSDPDVFLSPNYGVTGHHSMQEIIPDQGRVQVDFNEHGIEPMFSFKLPDNPSFQYMLLLRNLTADVPNSENIVELGFRVDPGRDLTYNLGQDVNFSVSLDSTTSKHYLFSDDVYLRQDVENSQIKFKKLWTRDEGYPLQCLGQTKQNGRVAIHYRLKTDGDPRGLIKIAASPTCFSGCLVTWVAAMTYIRFYPSHMYGPFPPYYIGFTEPHPPWQKPFCFAHTKCELFCAAVGDGPTMMNIKKVTSSGNYELRNVKIGKLLDFYISARVVQRQATVDDSGTYICEVRTRQYVREIKISLTVY
ncbi:hypothetical protein BaRGS_00035867 [Batillaria attramentaria]|uniref:Ig-like domain-containing protein n=1 Tax=Batillaria attramentaria TaxID=370345 RepID=A0ABD0JDG1_9CAEN